MVGEWAWFADPPVVVAHGVSVSWASVHSSERIFRPKLLCCGAVYREFKV
jgi:hypothetical protein